MAARDETCQDGERIMKELAGQIVLGGGPDGKPHCPL